MGDIALIQGKRRKRTKLRSHSMRGIDCFLFFGIVLLLGLAIPVYAEMDDETLFPYGLQEARVDMHSKTFLDPLPFDTSFFISGRVPSAIDYVEVMTSEFIRETVSFGRTLLMEYGAMPIQIALSPIRLLKGDLVIPTLPAIVMKILYLKIPIHRISS